MPLKTGATKATQTQPMAWPAEPGKRGRKRSRERVGRHVGAANHVGVAEAWHQYAQVNNFLGVLASSGRHMPASFRLLARVRFEHIQ